MRLAVITAALALCLAATGAEAAGFRFIDVPAAGDQPAMHGAIWYPCAAPAQDIALGDITLRGVKDCPASGDKLPLVVISHGFGGSFLGHHDTAEALADAGFAVAAISHPGDNSRDKSRAEELQIFLDRPAQIRRLIDFMLTASPLAARLDAGRVGFFGFSRGGYTGLVLIGARPDWAAARDFCTGAPLAPFCGQLDDTALAREAPAPDPRIKAAVIADPLAIFFTAQSFAAITVPVQLWGSERGGDGVTPESVAAVNRGLPGPHQFQVVPNSAHFAFLAPCPPALAAAVPRICTDAPGFDRVAFHRELDAAAVAFLKKELAAE
jgi:predicted dienelactone hydrolase